MYNSPSSLTFSCLELDLWLGKGEMRFSLVRLLVADHFLQRRHDPRLAPLTLRAQDRGVDLRCQRVPLLERQFGVILERHLIGQSGRMGEEDEAHHLLHLFKEAPTLHCQRCDSL
jgi:hypothetical protein